MSKPGLAAATGRRPTRRRLRLTHLGTAGFNHCMDVPPIAGKTGATVIGTESTTTNLARAGGVPEAQLLIVRGGEDFEFRALPVKVIRSLGRPPVVIAIHWDVQSLPYGSETSKGARA